MSPADLLAGNAWCAYVGTGGVELGCHRSYDWVDGSLFSESVETPTLEAVSVALNRLEEALQRGPSLVESRGLRVVVADLWLRESTLYWSDSLKTRADAEVAAREQLSFDGHRIEASDRVVVDDAGYGLPRLVVAWPNALLASLRSLATTLGIPLHSVVPVSMATWGLLGSTNAGARARAIAVVDDSTVLVAYGNSRPYAVHVRTLTEGADQALASLGSMWRRIRLREPSVANGADLRMLDLRVDPTVKLQTSEFEKILLPEGARSARRGSDRLELVAATNDRCLAVNPVANERPSSFVERLVASIALVVIGLSGWFAWQAAMQDRASREASVNVEATRTAAVIAPSAWRRDELPRVRSIGTAVGQLNVPVFALLSALVPPRDLSVFVLGIDIAGHVSSDRTVEGVKILAESESVEDMARYVAYVGDHRPFISAQLLRHELVGSKQPPIVRFTVDAAWLR